MLHWFSRRKIQVASAPTVLSKRHGFAVSEQHIVRAADTAMLVTQVLSHPVGIQALNHHAIFNMTAAMTAATAVI